MCIAKIINPEGLSIHSDMGFSSRGRIRPVNLRQDSYDNEYDFTTLWYDSFLSSDGRYAVIILPPPVGMDGFSGIKFYSDGGSLLHHKIVAMDRNFNIYIDTSVRN